MCNPIKANAPQFLIEEVNAMSVIHIIIPIVLILVVVLMVVTGKGKKKK